MGAQTRARSGGKMGGFSGAFGAPGGPGGILEGLDSPIKALRSLRGGKTAERGQVNEREKNQSRDFRRRELRVLAGSGCGVLQRSAGRRFRAGADACELGRLPRSRN